MTGHYITWWSLDDVVGPSSTKKSDVCPPDKKDRWWDDRSSSYNRPTDHLSGKILDRVNKWKFANPDLYAAYENFIPHELRYYLADNHLHFYFLFRPKKDMVRYVSDDGFRGKVARYRLEFDV